MFEHNTPYATSQGARIIGGPTPARLRVLKRVDAAMTEAMQGREHRFEGWEVEPLLVAPGPGRGGYIVAIRAVPSTHSAKSFPWDVLQSIAARILENAVHVRAVVPDVTTAVPRVEATAPVALSQAAEDILSA